MTDRDLMKLAVQFAGQCEPKDRSKVPCVGAVISYGDEILAFGHRGDDIHAEKCALDRVKDRSKLKGATVYTTLEPCTGSVRSKPEEACTNLLTEAQVKKVFIGILDPNQGVCGKGVLELQRHGIEVALFEHDLADRIREMNVEFIRSQQVLGALIVDPEDGATLETFKTGGKHTFKCTFQNEPGSDVFIVVMHRGRWWPQSSPSRINEGVLPYEYSFDVIFGASGKHEIHIVRASELGLTLRAYYEHVISENRKRSTRIHEWIGTWQEGHGGLESITNILQMIGDYPGIPMSRLPRGLDSQARVIVEIADPGKQDRMSAVLSQNAGS